MENISLAIYLLFLLDNLSIFLSILSIFLLIPVVYNMGSYISSVDNISFLLPFEIKEEKKTDIKKIYFPKIKKGILILFIPLILNVFIPNKETVIAMWAVPKIVNNEKVQEIGGVSLDIIEKSLQKWLEDLQGIEKEDSEKGYL